LAATVASFETLRRMPPVRLMLADRDREGLPEVKARASRPKRRDRDAS
jgi:hypothetical protein